LYVSSVIQRRHERATLEAKAAQKRSEIVTLAGSKICLATCRR
jgi:hypothetical protein